MPSADRLRGVVGRIAALVARALFPFGSERRVLRGPLRGVRFVVAPGMGATYALGDASYGAQLWAKRITPGMVVYDIGANCGQAAFVFAMLVGPNGAVYSFEPWPRAFQLLTRSLLLNPDMRGRLHPRQCAVAAAAGRAEFLIDESMPTQGKLSAVEHTYRTPNPRSLEVDTVSIDDVVAEPKIRPPELMKIDVEGAAGAVLRGARTTLARHKPVVYIELHGPEEQIAVREYLQGTGYRLWREDGTEVLDPVSRWESPLWCTNKVP
jgi:FkbM family methyltransferase